MLATSSCQSPGGDERCFDRRAKDCDRKEEFRERGEIVTAPVMQYVETCPLGKVIYRR